MIRRFCLIAALVISLSAPSARSATLTLSQTTLRPTPSIVGYNSGHFWPGSNTADWWRYSGVNGARVFITPSAIEPSDDIPGRGDGVIDENTFLVRRNALRADPLNPAFINWSYLTPKYAISQQHGSNLINVDYACGELRKLGVQILVCLTASEGTFPISDGSDWAGKWELWQHYYAQAFYLGWKYQVQRFQMYNEPNHNNAISMDSFIERLKLISDAVKCAQEDVNRIYSVSLLPQMFAPVTAGTASSTYPSWGKLVVTNRHVNFLGDSNASFSLIGHYNYHQYNSEPVDFGSHLASLHSLMQGDMSPESRYPTTVSEYNVHTASTFHTMPTLNLDSPSKYSRLGAIVSSLANNGIDEMYLFKFSQTHYNELIPVKKNGTHYVDNTNAPYNIGAATKGADVYRLWAKAMLPGGNQLSIQKGSGTSGIYATSSGHTKSFKLFCANYSSSGVSLTLDASAWNLPPGQITALSEVSETAAGGIRALLTNNNNGVFSPGQQASYTAWLLKAPREAQAPVIVVPASIDAMVADGANRAVSYNGATSLVVENSTTNSSRRSVAYLKFNLPVIYKPDIHLAALILHTSGSNPTNPASAHVYALTNTAWTEANLRWTNAPNLAQLVPAGPSYTNRFVNGSGVSAFMTASIIADSSAGERLLDVSDYVGAMSGTNLSFLIAREARYHDEPLNETALNITSMEANPSLAPRLLILRARDTDSDGIGDTSESSVFGTNPSDPDTDNDGATDGQEILVLGSNPGTYGNVGPSILEQPMNASADVGDNASFSVTALGTMPLSYQWFFNTTNTLPAATNATLILNSVQTNQAGSYFVRITNLYGAVTSSAAYLDVTVYTPPPVTNGFATYDPFNYEAGSALSGQGGWILNAGTGAVLEEGNLEAAMLMPSSGNRVTWGSPSMSLRLPLGTNIASGDFYYSFILRIDSMASLSGVGTLAGFTTGTGTEFVTKLNILPNGSGGYYLGTSKLSGTTYGSWSDINFSPGQSVFVVGRYRFQPGSTINDTCDLWLNPGPETYGAENPPTPTIDATGQGGTDIAQIDRFFFRGGGPAKVVADELRLGYTWGAVTTPIKPPLEIIKGAGQVIVRWPAVFEGFRLQSRSELSSGEWIDTDLVPVQAGSNFEVGVPISAAREFYRLAR